jgi:hypothetical protein
VRYLEGWDNTSKQHNISLTENTENHAQKAETEDNRHRGDTLSYKNRFMQWINKKRW